MGQRKRRSLLEPSQPEHMPYPVTEHESRLLVGDPVAEAYEWLKRYSLTLTSRSYGDGEEDDEEPLDFDEVISTAVANAKGNDRWGGNYINVGTNEGLSLDPTFWDKLAILKGIEIPHEKRNNFFSCAC